MIKKLSIIGSGNVASHLASIFFTHDIQVKEIYSHTFQHAEELASKVKANAIEDISKLSDDTDLFIIAIKDDFIEEVANCLTNKKVPIVHTSGSISIDVLKNATSYGSLYPLQTFSKHVPVDENKIPWCIEASNNNFLDALKTFTALFSTNTQVVDSKQRLALHVAAVFACNFTNAMLAQAEDICKEKEVDFGLLKPLIEETLRKSLNESPSNVQTGPAIRKDYKTINKHQELLNKDKREVYTYLSELIMNRYHDKTKL